MRLFIAEKPSLGRAIAEALPKPLKKQEGFIVASNGDHVTWCIGHLLEQAEPEAYDPAFKKWQLDHLPILPRQWQLQAKPKTKKQLSVIKRLIKQSTALIHAGDPDREGQLLVDELINFLSVPETKRKAMQRCLISDLNVSAVKRAINQLRSNQEFVPLSVSALARSRADWLYGINMTRLCSIHGQKAGYKGVLSVGRVQTPTLGLVVMRDAEIQAFVSRPFYEVFAQLQTPSGERFKAKWKPSEACLPHQDSEGRVINKALAQHVVERIRNKPAEVADASKKQRKSSPPLPYNLSALQIDAAKRFSMPAKQVLDVCQALYERHKLITYPRSDNRYLPQGHFSEGQQVVSAIANNCEALQAACNDADCSLRSGAWNDKKVAAHHAIIPTSKQLKSASLSSAEQNVYQLISRQYLAQFYPAWRYVDEEIQVTIDSGLFIAKNRRTVALGWKQLFTSDRSQASKPTDDQPQEVNLPELSKGDALHCLDGELAEKMTQPPAAFTDATLLAAMTGISRFVKEKDIRKVLRETDGLGTEATRAGIIDLLFKRGFLVRQGKQIHATETGKQLIASLPDMAVTPDMTAVWESQLDGISQKKLPYQQFMLSLTNQLPELMQQVDAREFHALRGAGNPKKAFRKKSSGRKYYASGAKAKKSAK